MIAHWQFVEDCEHQSIYWTWRAMRADLTIESQSPRFLDYGTAVADAIRHGFQPRQQHWMVVTTHTITHFRPGERPMTVSKTTGPGPEEPAWVRSRRDRKKKWPAHLERRKMARQ